MSGPVKLCVMHGWGGSYRDALAMFERITEAPVAWADGAFWMPRSEGMVVRRLLQESNDHPLIEALKKLTVARFLAACFEPTEVDVESATRFTEKRIVRDFAHYGLPIGPTSRKRRASQLHAEAAATLKPYESKLAELRGQLIGEDGQQRAEADARDVIQRIAPDLSEPLELLRSLPETGGDVDTVASGVFYAYALGERAAAKGEPFVHGRDWRFVFVNYHEGIKHLVEHAPAEIYLADLPIGAMPNFAEQVRWAAERGLRLVTYEDHHPYTPEQLKMLEDLRDAGLIETLAMSGPVQGTEQATEDQKCASEMVYQRLIADTSADRPAMQRLCGIAHAEDHARDREQTGRVLTDLIKGGVNKVELAQRLARCRAEDDIERMLDESGWRAVAAGWADAFEGMDERLWENVTQITLKRRPGDASQVGGPALGEGSDVPAMAKGGGAATAPIKVLVAAAIYPKPDEPRVPVGKATEYFARQCPDVDYFFYCYGSSLMVTRRLNQADLAINLGGLMPLIGTDQDGGHAGAAVCRPQANPDFPSQFVDDLQGSKFVRFTRYLAKQIETHTGNTVVGVRNRSRAATDPQRVRSGGIKVAAIAAGAILIGAVLVWTVPTFDPDAVRESNDDFYPQIDQVNPPPAAPETDDDPAAEQGVDPT